MQESCIPTFDDSINAIVTFKSKLLLFFFISAGKENYLLDYSALFGFGNAVSTSTISSTPVMKPLSFSFSTASIYSNNFTPASFASTLFPSQAATLSAATPSVPLFESKLVHVSTILHPSQKDYEFLPRDALYAEYCSQCCYGEGVVKCCRGVEGLELRRCMDLSLRGISSCKNLQIMKLIGIEYGLYGSVVSEAQSSKHFVKQLSIKLLFLECQPFGFSFASHCKYPVGLSFPVSRISGYA
ncbi:hypothetical protein NE237_026220 [Protea cynaroides]|uniref:Uncharacterized protein n=1 Tax=Protea cynaroides TaxID=273540 RepID=A0A9Q0H8H8_9MAGN|nr:hypothetical protein NE237_026220 [Protea cynaroides]